MLLIFQIVLLVLVQVGLFWLVKKKLPGFSFGTILILIISGLAGFTLLTVHSLRCWGACPTSPLSSADLGIYAIPVAFFDLIILGVVLLFTHKPNVSTDVETVSPTISPIPPVTLAESPTTQSVTVKNDFFSRTRNSKWYVPILAVTAFIVGYFSFNLIATLEGNVLTLSHTSIRELSYSVLRTMAIVEQVVLGLLALLFFVLSRRYYPLLFLYVGYLVKYTAIVYQNARQISESTLFYFNPVIISAMACALLLLGLRFGKKTGLMAAIVLSVFGLVRYNQYVLTTPDFPGFPFRYHERSTNSSQSEKQNTEEQGVVKAPLSWCHVHTREQRFSDSGSTQNLKEALELSGYSVFLLDEKKNLPVKSPLISVAEFQKVHGLSVTGALNPETDTVLDKLYSCGKASDYGLVFGHSDTPVSSITNVATRFSGILRGSILNFDSTNPSLHVGFFSRDYEGGAPIDAEFAPPDYSFATNFSGDKKVLKDAVCVSQGTLIDCKEIPNGYVAYFVQKSPQSPQISLYAEAVVSTGSSQFPTASVFADFNDSTLNEPYDTTGALVFLDQPPLNQEMYIKGVTADYKNPTSSVASKVKSFEEFVRSIKSK